MKQTGFILYFHAYLFKRVRIFILVRHKWNSKLLIEFLRGFALIKLINTLTAKGQLNGLQYFNQKNLGKINNNVKRIFAKWVFCAYCCIFLNKHGTVYHIFTRNLSNHGSGLGDWAFFTISQPL